MGLHVRCPILRSDSNQFWSSSSDFSESHSEELALLINKDRRTEGQTDRGIVMAKIIGACCEYENAPESHKHQYHYLLLQIAFISIPAYCLVEVFLIRSSSWHHSSNVLLHPY